MKIAKSFHKSTKSFKQRGSFLAEYGLALLIVSILLVSAFLAYNSNRRTASVNENISLITTIGANVQKKWGQSNLFSQATTSAAVTSRAIPEYLRDGAANTASNPFGGAITVVPVNLAGTADGLDITWANIPQDRCSDIVLGSAFEFRRVSIAGTVVKPLDGTPNLAAIETQCESAQNVTAVFTKGRS